MERGKILEWRGGQGQERAGQKGAALIEAPGGGNIDKLPVSQ